MSPHCERRVQPLQILPSVSCRLGVVPACRLGVTPACRLGVAPPHLLCGEGHEVPTLLSPPPTVSTLYSCVMGAWIVRQIRASKRGGALDQFARDVRGGD